MSYPNLGFSWDNSARERYFLFLTADHSRDGVISLCELELGDAFEALLQVGLDTEGVLGLREDLKEFVI